MQKEKEEAKLRCDTLERDKMRTERQLEDTSKQVTTSSSNAFDCCVRPANKLIELRSRLVWLLYLSRGRCALYWWNWRRLEVIRWPRMTTALLTFLAPLRTSAPGNCLSAAWRSYRGRTKA